MRMVSSLRNICWGELCNNQKMAMCAARGRARVCQTLSNSRLFALAPQVYLLKNQSKPYTKSSFNFKLIFVATSKDRLTSTWFQERTMTPDAALQLFEDFDKSLFSDPWLLDGDAVINAFVDGVNAKTILGEYIGKSMKRGLAWPSLHAHDNNHLMLSSKSPGRVRTARAHLGTPPVLAFHAHAAPPCCVRTAQPLLEMQLKQS